MAFIYNICLMLILGFITENTSVGIENAHKQCYDGWCDGVDCLSQAVANGNLVVCAQLGYGCSVTTEVTSKDTTVFAVCQKEECISYPWRQNGHITMKADCCDSDLCNDGTEIFTTETTPVVVSSTISPHYTSRATSKSLPNRVMIYISLMLMPLSAMLKLNMFKHML